MKQDLLNKLNIRNDETDQQLLKEIREILLNNKKNKWNFSLLLLVVILYLNEHSFYYYYMDLYKHI